MKQEELSGKSNHPTHEKCPENRQQQRDQADTHTQFPYNNSFEDQLIGQGVSPACHPPRSQHYVLKPETFGPGDGKAGRWISHISPAVREDRVPDAAGLVRPAPLVSAQGSRRSGRGRLQNGGARNRRGVRVRERGNGAGSFI